MATIKDIEIYRNWGKRPTGNYSIANMEWADVEKGDEYDLVKISINELNKPYYWEITFGFKCGTSKEEIRERVEEYAKTITDKDINDYRYFLEWGEKRGWD